MYWILWFSAKRKKIIRVDKFIFFYWIYKKGYNNIKIFSIESK